MVAISVVHGQSDCLSASNIEIVRLESKTISFAVSGVIMDDLSDANQGLKSISFFFTHDNLADIEVILTSPAGQSIQLIGPLGTGASATDLVIGWNVSFIPCDSMAMPDAGISNDQFSNESDWRALSLYNGSYYPFSGCFEDINTGTINGSWTLTINDGGRFDDGFIDLVEIKFLEQDGLQFSVCEADALTFSSPLELTACDFQDDLLLSDIRINNFSPIDDYNYEFVIADFFTGDIIDIQPFPDLRGFPIADYTICAISYQTIDSTELFDQLIVQDLDGLQEFLNQSPAPVCADIMENCTDVFVLPIPDTLKIDTTICDNGSFVLNDATGFVQEYFREGTFIRKIGANLCDSLVIVNITQIDIEAVISTDTDTIINCVTDTITLGSSMSMVNTPPNRLWSTTDGEIIGDETAAQIRVTKPGTYVLQIDNNQGCVDDTSIIIGESLDVPSVQLTVGDTIDCLNPNTMISVTSDDDLFNIEWSGPDFSGTGAEVLVSDGGMYIVQADFDNGCSYLDSIMVIENFGIPEFNVNVVLVGCQAQINFEDNADIPDNATWISPSGVELDELTPIVNEQGVYDLVATSGNGCIDTIPVTIEFEPPVNDLTLVGDTLTCETSSTTISIMTNTTFTSVLWEGEDLISSDDSIVVDRSGLYTARTIDEDNCPGIGVFEVLVDSIPPDVIIQGSNFGCTEEEITLASSSDADLSQAMWEGPATMASGEEIVINTVGAYSIAVVGDNGCIGRDTFIAAREEPFEVDILDAVFDCDLQPLTVEASISIPPQQIEWTGPNGFMDNQEEILAIDTGQYILAVTSADQCVVVDTINLAVRKANISISNVEDLTIDCSADSVQIFPVVIGDFTFAVWTNEDFEVFTQIDPFVTTPGRYQLEVMDDFGCVADTFLIVNLDTIKPSVRIDQMGVLACESTEVQLVAAFDQVETPIVLWLGDDGPLAPQDALSQTITEGGTYILRVFNPDNMCFGEDQVLIAENENSFVDVDIDVLAACEDMDNGAVMVNELLGGEGPAQLSLDSMMFEETDRIDNLAVGEYSIYVQDANGCVVIKPFSIPEGEQLSVNLGEEIVEFAQETICVGIDTSGVAAAAIQWYRDDELFDIETDSICFVGVSDEQVRIELVSENGCVSTDEVNVVIEDRVTKIYVPNSLKIGDADNGLFRLQSNDPTAIAEQLSVFDRWGNVMFSARNFGLIEVFGWDGTVDGEAVEEGVYGYVSLVRLQSGELRKLSGSLTVFR